ncbi:hypothetical protein [Stenotrophomonas tuberculopleuritidis]|uniref:hypothetical protein n=1 Tax=Stenotrophomonas tuberculopleuritidis TaxID=3055079 RepID=UPI0026E52BD2|nr:hypothetical protein [Stenotrophomonas sp. 704A1]
MNTVMPFNFEPQEKSAIDELSGISILRPRMLPDAQSDGSVGIEYQYALRRDGKTVGTMGLFGKEVLISTKAGRERRYTLDLSPDWVLEDILKLKDTLGSPDEPFAFVQSLAQGLVNSFAVQTGNLEDLRYVAFTRADALTRVAVPIPEETPVLDDGVIILASAFIHAHQV